METVAAVIQPGTVYVRKRLMLPNIVKGAQYRVVRKVSRWRIFATALLTGDFNRLHWDASFARKLGHQTVVAHGAVIMGFLSAASARLFVDGCKVTEVQAKFRNVLYAGDSAHCLLTIEEVNRRGRVKLTFKVTNDEDKEICSGGCSVFLSEASV